MLKKVFSYGFVEGIAKGLNKLTILTLPFFVDAISYGKIGLLVSLELLIPVISLLGFDRAVLRFYSQKLDFKNFDRTIFLAVLWLHLLLIALLLAAYLMGFNYFFGLQVFPDIFLVITLIYFQGTNQIKLNMLRVNENHRTYFQGRLFIQVLKFLLVILCVYLTNSYLGYLIGSIVVAISANIFYRVGMQRSGIATFEKKTFSRLFAFSWPLIFHGLAGSLLGDADKFILESYRSLTEVGMYTFAYTIGSSMLFAYIGITVFFEPLIYKEKVDKNREQLLNKFIFLAIASGLLFYVIISFLSIYILPYIYKDEYSKVLNYIPLISSAFLMYPFYLKSNYKMIYEQKSYYIALISIFSAALNIGLNMYFIPLYGIYSAVLNTIASYVLQALFFSLVSNRFKFDKEIIEIILIGSILIITSFLKLPYTYISLLIFMYLIFIYFKNLRNHSKLIK